jgi:cytochrome c553
MDFVSSCFRVVGFRVFVAAASFWIGGALVVAQQQQAPPQQYPIFTAEHLDEAMKTVGLAFGLTRSAIEKNSAENAKDYLIRSRDQLATTITFWRDRKRDDAVAILRETLKKMDALDAALSEETVNQKAASDLAGSVAASCEACHGKYREQDPASKAYRVKADAVR